MKIKEIRLESIIVKKNEEEIYNGRVEDAPEDLLQLEVSSIHFDCSKLIINV